MTVNTQLSVRQLLEHQARATRPERVLKFRAVILAMQGWFACDIAEALGKGTRTIQQWIADFNREGVDGLTDRRGGNHFHLTDEQEQQVIAYLDAKARDPREGVRHAQELIAWIECRFDKTYSLSGIYDMLHRLGFSWLMPRPCHEKNDPVVMEAFKKTRRRSWTKSLGLIPTERFKSGFRTKHVSARREH